jgi:Zn finger protein HypA/HybF involved in hydrogenase expression
MRRHRRLLAAARVAEAALDARHGATSEELAEEALEALRAAIDCGCEAGVINDVHASYPCPDCNRRLDSTDPPG